MSFKILFKTFLLFSWHITSLEASSYVGIKSQIGSKKVSEFKDKKEKNKVSMLADINIKINEHVENRNHQNVLSDTAHYSMDKVLSMGQELTQGIGLKSKFRKEAFRHLPVGTVFELLRDANWAIKSAGASKYLEQLSNFAYTLVEMDVQKFQNLSPDEQKYYFSTPGEVTKILTELKLNNEQKTILLGVAADMHSLQGEYQSQFNNLVQKKLEEHKNTLSHHENSYLDNKGKLERISKDLIELKRSKKI